MRSLAGELPCHQPDTRYFRMKFICLGCLRLLQKRGKSRARVKSITLIFQAESDHESY
jgi:hypothetical protein